MNDRVGLSADDADYLLAYLDLCERLGRGEVEDAEGELSVLNETYRPKITSKALKTTGNLQFVHEAFRRGRQDGLDSWSASQNC